MPFRVREEWRICYKTTKQRAMWVARAATEANNLLQYPYSDSESSRRTVDEAKRIRAKNKAAKGVNGT